MLRGKDRFQAEGTSIVWTSRETSHQVANVYDVLVIMPSTGGKDR